MSLERDYFDGVSENMNSQAEIDRLRAENRRLREAMRVAKELIGTLNDIAPASVKASNINQAWHVLNDNLSAQG
jgi:hypothetical protein